MVPIVTATQLDFTFMLSKFECECKILPLSQKENYGEHRSNCPDYSGFLICQILALICVNIFTSIVSVHFYWF